MRITVEAAAADVAATRIHDRERVTDRDRGIDRIAAGAKDDGTPASVASCCAVATIAWDAVCALAWSAGSSASALAAFAATALRPKGGRAQDAGDPVAREIGVVTPPGLAGLAARNRNPAPIPLPDVPNGAEALRDSTVLQMNGILIPRAGEPRHH